MAVVEVKDRVIWIPHIHGDPTLAARLDSLGPGDTLTLRVSGMTGLWEKMKNRPDGSPTPGLKPVGDIAAHWRRLFNSRRGDLVDLNIAEPQPNGLDADREAAWRALMALTKAGWRSLAPYGSRDELHER